MTETDDLLAIRARIEAYADAVFRQNAEDWIACWADDATWNLMGHEVSGRDAIVTLWRSAMSAFKVTAFFAQPGPIVITGDRATGRAWTQEILTTQEGAVRRVVGAYDDAFVKRGGVWLFARRAFRIMHEA